jgi:2-(1,2-epoxy-1,2-dihydrophenyl)acetyl-CoA isomerase
MTSSEGVEVEHLGPVARITLDRPEVMNRFEGEMREALAEALLAVGRDPSIRCVLITGAGDAFSAGADINGMLTLHDRGDMAEIRRRVELGAKIIRAVRAVPKPVVAALNGVAAGAGANLALACDLRVGSDAASLSESFVRIGLLPDWGGLYFLVRLIGPGRATELAMTGDRLDAGRLLDLGILNQVFPADSFHDDALAYATRLTAASPHVLARIKTGIDLATGGSLEDVLAFERDAQPDLFGTANCREGMAAFLERRTPVFEPLDD